MKKLLRVLLKLTLTLLLLSLIIGGSMYLWLRHGYTAGTAKHEAYLKENIAAAINTATPLDHLTLPPDLAQKKLILLGEVHGSAYPQELDLALVKALHRQSGLRHYVGEFDPIQATLLNHFIETGVEASLNRVFDLWTGSTHWGNTAFENKIRSLRSYNQTLPPERRIRLIGLDQIQHWPLAIDWLRTQLPGAIPADYVPQKANEYNNTRASRLLETIGQNPTWIKADPTTTLGHLRALLTQRAKGQGREANLFESYRFQVTAGELRDSPAYGLWGWFHVWQGEVSGQAPLAARIRNSTLPAAHNLATILVTGKKFDANFPIEALPTFVPRPKDGSLYVSANSGGFGPIFYVKGLASFAHAAPAENACTLFRLDAAASPYRSDQSFGSALGPQGSIKFTAPALHTADYVQYVAYVPFSKTAEGRTPPTSTPKP